MESKKTMTMQITDLPQRGVLSVRGPDAKTFLQGQLTCDMNTVTATESRLGAQCNLQGRVHSFFRIIQSSETEGSFGYYLMMPKALIPKALEGLKKYALFSKVTIEPMEAIQALGVVSSDLHGATEGDATTKMQNAMAELPGVKWLCAIPGDHPRYEIYGTAEVIAQFKEKLASQCQTIASLDWDKMEIALKLPEVLPETMDQFLPHHIGLVELDAISFDKGCYLGQEIVARMQWRGNIKKHLQRGTLSDVKTAPQAGALLYADPKSSGEPVGQIVRVAALGSDQYELLYVLNDNASAYYGVHKIH